jgi:hypothetical protein
VRAFACDFCDNVLSFENTLCLRCGHPQGFVPATLDLVALQDRRLGEQAPPADSLDVIRLDGTPLRRCANVDRAGCNWLVTDTDERFCASCRLTRTRPSDSDGEGVATWAEAEACKRRLIFQLFEQDMPVHALVDGTENGLTFDLLSSRDEPVTTGHADGVVTIDLAEGNDAHREAVRAKLAEPYRTLLGHFRHETGHFYWEVYVNEPGNLDSFRGLFGDEREDYAAAMEQHYAKGAPDDWADNYVSAYATMHPWEDWAETFAHYLHIRDTLQTASEFGIWVGGPEVGQDSPIAPLSALPTDVSIDGSASKSATSISEIMRQWVPLTLALNEVNRSMGSDDLYPFALAPAAVRKLGFVHDLVRGGPRTIDGRSR